jgi:hypothetical protein
MNTCETQLGGVGTMIGRQLADRLIDLARPGATIVDNSANIVHVTEHVVSVVDMTKICPLAHAKARIGRYRISRAARPPLLSV